MKYTPRPYQVEATERAVEFLTDERERGNGLIVAATGCHAKGYEILMADGTLKRVEEIAIGDKVMGDDGTPRTVLKLHSGVDTMYRITPKKGEPFVVNGGHILSLIKTKEHSTDADEYVEMSVEDYLKQCAHFQHMHKLYRCQALEFGNEHGMVVEPYFLGLFIGDGCSVSGIQITTMRTEVIEFLDEFTKKYGLTKRITRKGDSKAISYHITNTAKGERENPLKKFLMDRELYESRSGDKFIPYEYKVAKRADRLQLLGGLLDTDAHYDEERKMYEYCSKSLRLAKDVQFLCRSLGLYAKIGKTKVVNGTKYYRIQITGELSIIPTKVKIRQGGDRVQKKRHWVMGFSVEQVGQGEYYGFTLDKNNLYVDWQFIVHHNCGKSLIISEIADKLNTNILVFCPSKEILEQNYAKMKTYTDDCAMYSASVGKKKIAKVTFATIGSVKSNPQLFKDFEYILVDECHLVNPKEGMYHDFFNAVKRKIVGLTATPYRLETSGQEWNWRERRMDMSNAKSMLIPIVGNGQLFEKVIYNIDTEYLLNQGYLAKLQYFDVKPNKMDDYPMFANSSGAEFSESSLAWMEEHTGFYYHLVGMIKRLLRPKSGVPRSGILVFVRRIDIAEYMATEIPSCRVVSGKMSKKERGECLKDFAEGKFDVLLNVGTLVVGYDRPNLDTVVIGTPTMSLAKYSQQVGRCIRPYSDKIGWVVDLGGNIKRFGEVHRLKFRQNGLGQWNVYNDERQLTNVKL